MLTIDEKKVCFDGVVTSHAHFMCKRCGRLMDVQLPGCFQECQPAEADFIVEETHLYYKGVCKSCAHKVNA